MAISSVSSGGSIDVNDIVNKLMMAESRPFVAMQDKEKAYAAKLSAYGTLSGALGSFQSAVSGLADPTKFKTVGASSTESSVLTATAGKDTVKGSYAVNVTQLSQAQTLTSAGQASTTALIGSGAATTLTFEFGSITGGTLANGAYTGAAFDQDATRSARTVTIDSSNNSLQGIRDAINKANVGVTATIISDGGANPNRLVLTSAQTGETSAMRIGVSGDPALDSLLGYSADGTQNMLQNSVAQNAKLTINGVAISSPSNNVSEAIQGVTISALKIGTSTVGITSDSTGAKSAINAFIKSYNDLNSTIAGLTTAPKASEGKGAGVLLGDSTTRNLQSSLRKMFFTPVPGMDGDISSLSQLGVSFQPDGSLKLDNTKLQKAIDTNLDDVSKLLSTVGSTSDSLVSFVGSTSSSTVGTKNLTITQMATQGSATGSSAAGTSITKDVNDQLSLTINGVTSTATLLAGNYTAASLASHVQSIINGAVGATGASATSGTGVTVKQDSGIFTITSNKYGASSKISLSGSAAAGLLGTPTVVDGLDVAGTIGGALATGSGQTLTGDAGSASSGIQVKVSGGVIGERGSVNVSKGVGAQFTELIDSFLSAKGTIPGKNAGINASLADIAKQRAALNVRLTQTEKDLRRQYSTLDVTLSGMSTTSNFLAQQLASLGTIR
ncbi:flagellar filament capping protein FliD [Massilia antarctica]|uniref:flagellar filament capping protein FliD n=1 Tax=Massilia antarctica TaxID=2765360 RepID=UPI0006BB693D|nr:flagellar filament capping protein FliD [Massilia sp. H27-R4]CUI04982.1 Flagellar hook-associated protein FliD [Janthinobacterium sp. CG23_2]CUU28768.1 Flagellar hook-associated protein FliD [Janthinobacterium sp. CG23_2]